MYLTAHHVRSRSGQEGINAFLYLHPGAHWDVPPQGLPDEDPGQLVEQSREVPPGGNSVRSYLDIVAPDGTSWSDISRAVITFVALEQQRPLPWVAAVGRCAFRFGLEGGLAGSWRHELGRLFAHLEHLHRSHFPPGASP